MADAGQTVAANTTPSYDPGALLHEVRLRLEGQGLLERDQPCMDVERALDASANLLEALGVQPVDPSPVAAAAECPEDLR